MKPNIIITYTLLFCGLFLQQSLGFQTSPIEMNRTNLNVDYPFLLIKVIHIPKPNNETVFFTVVVMPMDAHDPENFEGWLEVEDNQKQIITVQVCPSRSPYKIAEVRDNVPKKLIAKSIAFQFSISTNYLVKSSFKLVEPRMKLDDSPNTYHFNLKDFSVNKF
jgi:hypothetical protein